MMGIEDIIFLGIWAFIGSVLGYCAFSIPVHKSFWGKLGRCLLSIGIGMFISFPLCNYLIETELFSKQMSILIGGLGAFGLPDFILKYWPQVLQRVMNKVVDTKIDKKDDYE